MFAAEHYSLAHQVVFWILRSVLMVVFVGACFASVWFTAKIAYGALNAREKRIRHKSS